MSSRTHRIDPLFAALQAVGDSWSWLIMREVLLHDAGRFNVLQRRLGISRETLSTRLDSLTTRGLLERVEQDASQAVHYRPTETGRDLFTAIVVTARWGRDWCTSPGDVSTSTTHLGCGEVFTPELRCGACERAVDARDVKASSDASNRGVASRERTRLVRGPRIDGNEPDPLALALGVIGDRWTSLVIRECFFGARRFETFVDVLGIATNTLTSRLKHLVVHGVLERVAYQRNPIRHEYRLTESGLALYPISLALLTWGAAWFGADTAPVELVHTPCGTTFEPHLTCQACGHPVYDIDDIASDISEHRSV